MRINKLFFYDLRFIFEYIVNIRKERISFSRLKKLFKLKIKERKNKSLFIKNQHFIACKIVKDIDGLDCQRTLKYQLLNRKNSISAPSLINSKKVLSKIKGSLPDLNIYLLNKVQLVGQISSIIFNDKAYHSYISIMDYRHDIKNSWDQGVISLKIREAYYKILKVNKDKNIDYTYISLLHEYSGNYYHWMFELLPKIIMLNHIIAKDKELKDKEYRILVDSCHFKQFIESLNLIIKFKFQIQIVEKGELFKVKNLLCCTDFWISLDNTYFSPKVVDEFFPDKYAITLVKEAFNKTNPIIKPYRKIYLNRKSSEFRRLSNEEEVQQILTDKGFEVINSADLSLIQQIKIFNEAEIIVGGSGASFTNMIFMREGTRAISFYPNTFSVNYYVFQQIADVAGVSLELLLTETKNPNGSVHQNDARVDVAKLIDILE